MAIGTDQEMLTSKTAVRRSGRPSINRELGYQLIKAGYSAQYICRVLKCKKRTVRLMRAELKAKGDTEELEKSEKLDKIALDFDEECTRVVGISFYDWVKTRTKAYKPIFNFCKRCWEKIWGKPSLFMVRDPKKSLGDEICMKWLAVFGEDTKRIRRRKKHIRYLFRFLGRSDLLDRHLTMSKSKDPEEIREIPELTLLDFPQKLQKAIDTVEFHLGYEAATALKFKIVTQMRTGSKGRELMGIIVGQPEDSWIIMSNPDQFRGKITAKLNEKWILEWIPLKVRHEIYRIYKDRKRGEKLFSFKINDLRKTFKEACEKAGLPPLKLHDLRKVAVTWLWSMGIPLEIATELNVGWRDLNTVKKHYLHMRELLKKSERESYREKIPEWFKEGLDEYIA